jgi:hypothetical protein
MHRNSKRRSRRRRLRFLSPRRAALLFVLFSILDNSNIHLSKAYGWKLSNLFRRKGNDRNGNGSNADDSSMSNADGSFENSSKDKIGSAEDMQEVFTKSESAINIDPMTNEEGWFAWNRIVEDAPLHLAVDDVGGRSKDEYVIVSDECVATSEPVTRFPAIFRPFSRILPSLLEKTQQTLQVSKEHISRIILYQPPLGIVTVIVVLRLVLSGRLFRWYTYYYNHDVNIEDRLFLQKIQQKDRSSQSCKRRSFVFNSDDASYSSYGGVERVRTRLCLAALQSVLTSLESNVSSLGQVKNSLKRQQYTDLI